MNTKAKISAEIKDFESNILLCSATGNRIECQKQKELLNNYLDFVYLIINDEELKLS